MAKWVGLARRLPDQTTEQVQRLRKRLTQAAWASAAMLAAGLILLFAVPVTAAKVLGIFALFVGVFNTWVTTSQRKVVDQELGRRAI